MSDPLSIAKEVIALEAAGLAALLDALSGDLGARVAAAIERLSRTDGRIIVTGMGKSGHVARKIAATFASTGTPALYVHPAEASHGDLGMITRQDTVLALSKSGETDELHNIVAYTRRFAIPLIAVTGRADTSLTKNADLSITLPAAGEACDVTHAPTTSTLMMMALGDALAIALLRQRGFTAGDFQNYHPGGNLGAALKRVRDLVNKDRPLPLISQSARMRDAVTMIDKGGAGCVGLIDKSGNLAGLMTDGDLRRAFTAIDPDAPAADYMTRTPKTVSPETLAGDALRLMSENKITSLFVVVDRKPVGLLHVHDCLSLGVL